MTRRPPYAVAFIVALGAMLAGCGFHLQGSQPLPDGIGSLYVAYSNDYQVGQPPLVDTLEQRLRERGLLGGPGADAKVLIERIDNRQRIVSVSPIDGRVAEYELTTEVVFDYIVNGRARLDNENLFVTRFYSFDDTARLAAEAEQDDLLTSMHRQLADRILFRIQSVKEDGADAPS